MGARGGELNLQPAAVVPSFSECVSQFPDKARNCEDLEQAGCKVCRCRGSFGAGHFGFSGIGVSAALVLIFCGADPECLPGVFVGPSGSKRVPHKGAVAGKTPN